MRIIFMGTPDFAVPSLDALLAAGHEVVAVYSQPPRAKGRGQTLHPTPVAARAAALGLPVETPATLRDADVQARFAGWGAEVAVVAAYGLILPRAILDAPARGCINVHASLLPRWRGAAPVQRAILAGDAETGVTIMAMEAGLDTGAMFAATRVPIADKDAGTLTAELASAGATLLIDVLRDWPLPVAQPEAGVTYAAKIDKAEARLDWMASAPAVARQVRAFAPAPGAWFECRGERIRVLAAEPVVTTDAARPGTVIDARLTIACNPGALRVTRVQRAGRGSVEADAFLRGFAIPEGTVL